MAEKRDQQIGLRVTASERAQLEQRAGELGVTLTEFLLTAALGRELTTLSTSDRLDALEARVQALERA